MEHVRYVKLSGMTINYGIVALGTVVAIYNQGGTVPVSTIFINNRYMTLETVTKKVFQFLLYLLSMNIRYQEILQ